MHRPLAILAALALSAAIPCHAQEDHPASRDAIGTAEFFVEEFIPNRIHVKADAPEERRSTTDALTLRVRAEEMFGQAAGGRAVKVTVRPVAIPFQPKGFDGFVFGDPERTFTGETVEMEPDTLGEDGEASMTLGLPPGLLPPAALRMMIQATVLDSGGRGVTAHLERTFDPYPHYIGLRMEGEGFPKPGGEARFGIVAVKPDGTVATDAPNLDAEVFRVTHNSVLKRHGAGYHFETSRELHSRYRAGVALQDGRGTLAWTPDETGSFLVRVADPASSASTSRMFHVSTGQWDDQPWSLEKPETVEVAPDRAEYAPGETARILVKAPFAGTLVLTLEQDRVLTSSVFQMPTNTLEVPVPLSTDHMPNVFATAVVVRPVRPAEKWMPHRAVGSANITVSPSSRRLAVEIGNPAEVRPESKLAVRVSVADAATSAPAKSLVTLWAVDEGVLSLTGFETPDPIGYFYGLRRLGVQTADNYRNLMPDLVRPAAAQSHTGGGDGMPGSLRLSPIASERVKPVVLWAGTRETDTSGVLTAELDVPRHMGRLRVMAVAADGPRFGAGESNVFVRSPLMVQDNLPRFLAPGDRVESGFVVFNNSDAPVSGTLTVRLSGPLAFEGRKAGEGAATVSRDFPFGGGAGIAPRGQATVRVPLDAAAMAGVARVAFSAKAGEERYAGDTELPVRPASPHRRLSGLEQLGAGATTRFTIPSEDFLAGTTSGSLVVSGMPQLRLASGLRYVVRYPYGCLEQTVSGAFPLLKLRSLAAQGALEGVVEDSIAPMVQSAIDRILMMQNWSGGFTMWPGSGDPWPWATVYAAHFLVEAKREGYIVPAEELNSLLGYVGGLLQGNESDSRSEQAYAAWVLAIAGRPARDRMELLAEKRAELSGEARAMLAASFMLVGDRTLAASLLEEASAAAKAPVVRATSGILRSERRQTAILLLARLEQDPTSSDVSLLAKRLHDAMNAEGHWGTTQDTAFALLALGRHADAAGGAGGEFQADLRMGDKTASASNAAPFVAHEYLGNRTVEATLRGPGSAFAFWTVEGVPQNPPTTAVSKGLTVSKRLLNRKGVELKPADGVKQGDFVVVEIAVSATQSLDNVIIEDLLPAGFEVENKNLKSAESMDGEGESGEGMSVQRSEARDDRMVAFVDVAAGEKRVFRYAVRAVTPGRYVMPPVQASCMYDPDVQALQPGGTVVVR